ncbi:hypothetical protein MYX06_00010 [Patescibacteria group bacterium AH-259-L05]|nr:hypothetical protein [Patescibacteria group bacterium AH-259-L05]
MKKGIKQCQNCSQEFRIEPEDFDFYKKINVPTPTFCPDCQLQRKYAFRNERTLYKRTCDAPGHTEDLVAMYSSEKSVNVYDQKYWWSDKWDPMEYGKEYDFSTPFFSQIKELIQKVPWPNLVITNSVNSDFCNSVLDIKNCYLLFAAIKTENCAYGVDIDHCTDSFDLYYVLRNELCYEVMFSDRCYRSKWIYFSEDCTDSSFLWDCVGCSHCFGCVGLRNKSYHIFNQPYTKEEYFSKIKEFDLGSFKKINRMKEKCNELRLRSPMKYARIYKSTNVTGDNISNSKNCRACFNSIGNGLEDCSYIVDPYGPVSKNCHSGFALSRGDFCYDFISIRVCRNILFSKKIWTGDNIQYSYNCHSCSNCFGCVGLRNKQYCILNKQYSKEEYEKLVPQIIGHMNTMPYTDKKDRIYKYGEFFPAELSPFAYNETIAQEYFPLTKQQTIEQGYQWKDSEQRDYEITIKSEDLSDHINDVSDDILKQVIRCEHKGECREQCTTAFKIIPDELQFYRKMNLPVPRLCPNCRHYQRLKQRNPLKLWHRKCQCTGIQSDNKVYQNVAKHSHGSNHCPNEFETTYAPDRKEIIYCEKCYQSEVV